MTDFEPDFQLSLPARAENVAVVRHAMRRYVEQFDVDDVAVSDILLAVTEACTNCVVHAYIDREGIVEVRGHCDGDELLVHVRDHGGGIVPRIDSPGLGLGLPVIMALTESMSIHDADGGGTEVSMTFALREAAGDLAS
jgi:serine/threonine-protein kinase RsbW/stage II sporulation protein AB (anti-sigma F factor)